MHAIAMSARAYQNLCCPSLAGILAGAGLAFILLLSAPAFAAGLQVSPTLVQISARQTAEGLWLSNTGSAPLQAQVRIFRWTQADGENRLDATRDVAVSPSMTVLPVGGRQLVRLVRLGPSPAVEQSYRVLIDELPGTVAEPAEAGGKPEAGLRFVLRYSVPVFLQPPVSGKAAPTEPGLRVKLQLQNGVHQVEVSNSGPQRAQIADLVFVASRGERQMLAPGLLGYVLPGQTMRWPLTTLAGLPANELNTGVLKARINGESTEQMLPLVVAGP